MLDPAWQKQEEEWSRRYLQEMSVMQEIWMGADDGSCRVATLLWRFSQTQHGEPGIATWRKVIPPPPRIRVNSPVPSSPPPLQHSMVLDTALQELAIPQPTPLHIGRFAHGVDIFAEDSENIVNGSQSSYSSPSPALASEYTHSFPSSTSTSFPPSVTNDLIFQANPQEPKSCPQEVTLHHHDIFAVQESLDFSQETHRLYEDPETQYQDHKYETQDSGLHPQDPPYYTRETLNSLSRCHTQQQVGDLYRAHEDIQPSMEHSHSEAGFAECQPQLIFEDAHRCLPIAQSQSVSYSAPAMQNGSQPHHDQTHVHHSKSKLYQLHHNHQHHQHQQPEHESLDLEPWAAAAGALVSTNTTTAWEQQFRFRSPEADYLGSVSVGEVVTKTSEIELDPSQWMGIGMGAVGEHVAEMLRHPHLLTEGVATAAATNRPKTAIKEMETMSGATGHVLGEVVDEGESPREVETEEEECGYEMVGAQAYESPVEVETGEEELEYELVEEREG